jgi:hypothetical protein
MSAACGRRRTIALLLVLLAGAVLLALAPGSPGAVRVSGVSVLWWYVGAAAPVAATAITITFLFRS